MATFPYWPVSVEDIKAGVELDPMFPSVLTDRFMAEWGLVKAPLLADPYPYGPAPANLS